MRAVSPKPPLLAHTSSESRGIFRQKARSLAPLNGWACAVKICHDGMLEDTNSLDAPHLCIDEQKVLSCLYSPREKCPCLLLNITFINYCNIQTNGGLCRTKIDLDWESKYRYCHYFVQFLSKSNINLLFHKLSNDKFL